MANRVLTKIRAAEETYGSDFTDVLAQVGADSISNPDVEVHRPATQVYDEDVRDFVPASPWVDVTTEFVAQGPAPQIDGGQVLYRLVEAATGTQAPGLYVVLCRVETDTGEKLVDRYTLEVLDTPEMTP